MKKCINCDDRGMIDLGGGARRSCKCGYDNWRMEQIFKGVSIDQLLEHARGRILEKSRH